MKKFMSLAMAGILVLGMAACGNSGSADETTKATTPQASETAPGNSEAAEDALASGPINILSREDGSGTRGAFVELFGIQEEIDGEKVDMTTLDAQITNSTSVMMTTVAGDTSTIGYISLGSLNETVKALQIDGVDATVENVKNGSYKVSRPFNIVTKEGLSDVAQDFVNFIMSADGQAVVSENGCIPVDGLPAFEGTQPSGKVVLAGSSSVAPVMEKLQEAYLAINPNAEIEVQQSDSTTGVTSTNEGLCDIGMASRDLKESETAMGLTATVIATDGIAVIVNNENPMTNLTSDQVKAIYTGEVLNWEDLAK